MVRKANYEEKIATIEIKIEKKKEKIKFLKEEKHSCERAFLETYVHFEKWYRL